MTNVSPRKKAKPYPKRTAEQALVNKQNASLSKSYDNTAITKRILELKSELNASGVIEDKIMQEFGISKDKAETMVAETCRAYEQMTDESIKQLANNLLLSYAKLNQDMLTLQSEAKVKQPDNIRMHAELISIRRQLNADIAKNFLPKQSQLVVHTRNLTDEELDAHVIQAYGVLDLNDQDDDEEDNE